MKKNSFESTANPEAGYYDKEPKVCAECGLKFTEFTPKGVKALLYRQSVDKSEEFLALAKIREIEAESGKDKLCLPCWQEKQKREKNNKKR